MPTFHYLRFRAFAHETEAPEAVHRAVVHCAHRRNVEVAETVVEGSHHNRIAILEAEVKADAAAKALFADLARDDPDAFTALRGELPRRVDEHLNFYFRLDKQAAFAGKTRLATDDDAVSVRGKIRSFGPKRDVDLAHLAVTELESFFGGISG